jgi:hypothetical protein
VSSRPCPGGGRVGAVRVPRVLVLPARRGGAPVTALWFALAWIAFDAAVLTWLARRIVS